MSQVFVTSLLHTDICDQVEERKSEPILELHKKFNWFMIVETTMQVICLLA